MAVTDPVADYLTRIRNGALAGHKKVDVPYSTLKERISKVLNEKGYISGYTVEQEGSFKTLRIRLKYLSTGGHAIKQLTRVSSPGQRIYKGKSLPKHLSGIGLYILSTSKGIMSDKEARELGVGGEVLFKVH